MNQSNLYATLNSAGCKILSFEDYPSNYGSWRVCFFLNSILCEITSNRADNQLILSTKSTEQGIQLINFPSNKLITEQLELMRVSEWLRNIQTYKVVIRHVA